MNLVSTLGVCHQATYASSLPLRKNLLLQTGHWLLLPRSGVGVLPLRAASPELGVGSPSHLALQPVREHQRWCNFEVFERVCAEMGVSKVSPIIRLTPLCDEDRAGELGMCLGGRKISVAGTRRLTGNITRNC